MKTKVLLCCLASCLALTTIAEAQPGGGGGGRRGGFGGAGGFGGPFGRANIFSVAGNEEAQKDIGITTDEAAKVKEVVDQFNEANGSGFRSFSEGLNFRDMSQEERDKFGEKVAENTKTNTEKFLPKLKDVLSADQFTRLQQITWQAMGSSAFTESEVIKSLNITSDQQSKIKTIRSDYEAKGREMRAAMLPQGGGGGGGGREAFAEMQEKTRTLNKERDGKVEEVLTKDQLDKFATLVGKKFDTEKLGFGAFGRRGGGGPGGGGGGGGNGGRSKRPQPKAE